MKKFLVLVLILVVAISIFVRYGNKTTTVNIAQNEIAQPTPRAPTEEEMRGKRVVGDYVPSSEETADGWILSNPLVNGQQFSYPKTLGRYISLQPATPTVKLLVEEYSCKTGTSKNDGMIMTTIEKKINSKTYCISTSSEGAAGHTYKNFEYTSKEASDFLGHANFTLSYPNCGNYGEDEEAVCRKDQKSLNIDAMADRMVNSIRML